jgi:hypothetical protein
VQLPGSASAELLLSVSGSNIGDNVLRTIDSTDGSTVDASVTITLVGHTVRKATGLARHPQTGVLYALLRLQTIQFPALVTLDEFTGVATSVGNTSDAFAGIAFGADGTLYAVSGDGGAVPEWLYTLDLSNASGTLQQELGDGDDGETLGFNPDDGLLYHASGLGQQNNSNVGEIFETIDPGTLAIVNVPLSGFDYEGLSSLLYRDGAFFAGDLNPSGSSRFFRITTGGVITYLGDMDHVAKGLAPVAGNCEGVDCSGLHNACNVGVCNVATGMCESNPFSPTTICRPGSGDVCDPDESCTGVAAEDCPADVVSSATTICDPGSGDLCDPDESCTGLAGDTCPVDVVASATTLCRQGSGDVCDPDESCTGLADAACPGDVVASATTICDSGSGDICDPDESCTGLAGDACPPDVVASATTVCRQGSGDLCDPDESCTGLADAACPGDVVASATTICDSGSGDICDPDESCTGVAGDACPADVVAPATTLCRPSSGDVCDLDESCTGVAEAACPHDTDMCPEVPALSTAMLALLAGSLLVCGRRALGSAY